MADKCLSLYTLIEFLTVWTGRSCVVPRYLLLIILRYWFSLCLLGLWFFPLSFILFYISVCSIALLLTWTPMCTSDELDSFHSIPEKIARATLLSLQKTKKKKKITSRPQWLSPPLLALNFSALTFHRRIGGDAWCCSRGQSTSYNRQSRFGEDRSELLQLPGSFRTFVYRRSKANRSALLHQFLVAKFPPSCRRWSRKSADGWQVVQL